jgi:hypothetical protein
MSSIRLQIRDRIITELNTSRPGDVPAATKRRWMPGEPITESRIAVFFIEEANRLPSRTAGIAARSLQVAVQCVTAVAEPDEADDAVEPMIDWAVKVLADSNLNDLASWVEEVATRWSVAQMDRVYVAVTVVFQVNFQTKRTDMEKQA